MTADTLRQLFLQELKTVYYVEEELMEDLEGAMRGATDEDLGAVLEEHREETSDQIARLEDVFTEMGEKSSARESKSFDGLKNELDHMEGVYGGELRNIVILGSVIKAERLEISMYEHLLMLARDIEGEKEIRMLLEKNLEEEKAALEKLQDLKNESTLTKLMDKLRE